MPRPPVQRVHPPRWLRDLGIRVSVARDPTLHELRDAIVESGLSIVYVDVER